MIYLRQIVSMKFCFTYFDWSNHPLPTSACMPSTSLRPCLLNITKNESSICWLNAGLMSLRCLFHVGTVNNITFYITIYLKTNCLRFTLVIWAKINLRNVGLYFWALTWVKRRDFFYEFVCQCLNSIYKWMKDCLMDNKQMKNYNLS